MTKDRTISIRISVDQYNFVKKMNGNFYEIWQIGFEKWAKMYPEFLQEKLQEYKNLVLQCHTSLNTCITNVIQRDEIYDELYHVYISQGRSIEKPDKHDQNWIKSRLEQSNNYNCSVAGFLEYCRKRFKNEKQKRLTSII